MRLIAVIIVLTIAIAPVLALKNLSKEHFTVKYVIDPKEECFTGGERIRVNYEIYPAIFEYRLLIGGDEIRDRTYTFSTDLSDAYWILGLKYYKLPSSRSPDSIGKEASIGVKRFYIDDERSGVEKITANLTATVPICNSRLCNFTAVKANCEDCERDALPEVKIYVVNEIIFRNDIKSLRAKLIELEQKLKAEGLYEEEDFKKVKDTINSAEDYLIVKKFLDANAKLLEADDLLKQLADLTNKKIAENLYSDVSSKLSEIQKTLLNSSVLLEKLKTHSNYTQLAIEQKNLENEFNDLKDLMKNVESLIGKKEFTNAIESLRKIEVNVTKLREKITNFTSLLTSELEKLQTSWIPFSIELSHIAIAGAIGIAVVAIFIGLRFRKRRKWDELR